MALSGYGLEWISSLFSVGGELNSPFNCGPSAFIGYFWVPIGAALAIWLTIRGRLGLASLAISPYWLPYYFLMLVLEAARGSPIDARLRRPGPMPYSIWRGSSRGRGSDSPPCPSSHASFAYGR